MLSGSHFEKQKSLCVQPAIGNVQLKPALIKQKKTVSGEATVTFTLTALMQFCVLSSEEESQNEAARP